MKNIEKSLSIKALSVVSMLCLPPALLDPVIAEAKGEVLIGIAKVVGGAAKIGSKGTKAVRGASKVGSKGAKVAGGVAKAEGQRVNTGNNLSTLSLQNAQQSFSGVTKSLAEQFPYIIGDIPALLLALSPSSLHSISDIQYKSFINDANKEGKLLGKEHPVYKMVVGIFERIKQNSGEYNKDSSSWNWEVNVVDSPIVNAFCMPGGKILVYTGLIDKLQLTNPEIAGVIGHEVAHALHEHSRERILFSLLQRYGAQFVLSHVRGGSFMREFGLEIGGMLGSLKFSRENEIESDKTGMFLAARSGFDPKGSVTCFEKLGRLSAGKSSVEWLSTHPSGDTRVANLKKHLGKAMELYNKTNLTAKNPL